MATGKLPFNINILDPGRSRLNGLLAVESADIYGAEGDFHPRGLYSSEVFGRQGTAQRRTKHGYIDLKVQVIHPKIFLELTRLKNLYKGILSGTVYATWDETLKDFIKSDILDGETGYQFFMDHFLELELIKNKSISRELRINLLNKYRDKALLRYLVVLPAGLRDIEIEEGRTVEDDINGLYRKAIRASNTISTESVNNKSSALDTVRWSLQMTINEIYNYLETILVGKKGFLLAKWGSRVIDGGTRNVVTGMDPAPLVLGSPEALTTNDTVVGLHQFMKGAIGLAIHHIRDGPMSAIINSLPNKITVVDSDTLESKIITPSKFIIKKWGSDDGIENLINGFVQLYTRHKPILIDGDYACLIYRDDTTYQILHDIDELPSTLSKDLVRPITWVEMFYISILPMISKVAGYVTRYPITGDGSVVPTLLYVRTTIVGESLLQRDSAGQIIPGSEAIQMPILDDPFFDSMSVNPNKLPGLSLDYDGDFHSNLLIYIG